MGQLHIYTPNTAKQINIKKKKKTTQLTLAPVRSSGGETEVFGDYYSSLGKHSTGLGLMVRWWDRSSVGSLLRNFAHGWM